MASNCSNQNCSNQNCSASSAPIRSNGYLIIVILYILLAIIIGSFVIY